MKKLLVLFAMAFVLGGCSSNVKKTPPLPELNFTGNMSVTYNDFDLLCRIDNNLATGCNITVAEPELISGLKMTVKNGVCSISMGEIKYTVESSVLKQTEFASELTEAFEQILTTTTVHQLENGNWMYSGNTGCGKFNFVQDGVNGFPVSLTIPEADLYISFSEIQ